MRCYLYKSLIAVVLLINSRIVLADFWGSSIESGETIYITGHYDKLIVGQRGVGFSTTLTLHDKKSVTLKIDNGNSIPIDTELLYSLGNAHLFKNSKEILPLILKAKRVELSFNSCGNPLKSSPLNCMFTAKGEAYSTIWEFEKPLNTSFEAIQLNLNEVNSPR